VEEKYHRATVSQVQLCSYFTGDMEILALKESYREEKRSAVFTERVSRKVSQLWQRPG
jgi:hypothetical protein